MSTKTKQRVWRYRLKPSKKIGYLIARNPLSKDQAIESLEEKFPGREIELLDDEEGPVF